MGTAEPKGYPIVHGIIFSHKCLGIRGGGRGGDFCGYCIYLLKKLLNILRGLFAREWLNMCLQMGSSELILFALIVCAALLHFGNCLYVDPQVFSICSSGSPPAPYH